jgi:ATP synthase subunit 6
MIKSPLEQFQILPIILFDSFDFIFTISNLVLLLVLGTTFLIFLFFSFYKERKTTYVIPNRFQILLETIYLVVFGLIKDNVGVQEGKIFFPYIFVLFFFILTFNIIGLVPYSFTVTSHIIVTFFLAIFTFLGINIVCIQKHKIQLLSLFLPSGSSFLLSLLLIPIEIISYCFRPISLSVRLFANMMAGHTLLKVIGGFAWAMLLSDSIFIAVLHIIPLGILVLLMGLELAVAIIQAYVFTILVCIYLKDAIHLH